MLGKLVKSKSGHDKDTIYIVVSEDKGFAYLSDGVYKPIDKLKKKNKKHLQIINKESDVGIKILNNQKISNEEIKREIKLFEAN